MTVSKPTLSAFDENLLLEEALERALRHGDNASSLNVPALAELSSLLELAHRVGGSAQTVEPRHVFRAAARARLVASMRARAAPSRRPARQAGRFKLAVSGWCVRLAAALSAVLAGTATMSASASALPGEPLYVIKQTAEQITLQTAIDDDARRQLLLRQAQTRLEETSRLLDQGRDAAAGQNSIRYSEALDGAANLAGASQPVEPIDLQTDHTRLARLLADAPPSARPGLQRALEATERVLARSPGSSPRSADFGAQDEKPTPKSGEASDRTVETGQSQKIAVPHSEPAHREATAEAHAVDDTPRPANPPKPRAVPAPRNDKAGTADANRPPPQRRGRP